MPDKMRRTFPINITLTDREQPTAAKLTAIATQSRGGLGIIEEAVGDIWNQSGDSYLSSGASRRTLRIPSIGRLLGTSDALSPYFEMPDDDFLFEEDLVDYADCNSVPLTFEATTFSGVLFSGLQKDYITQVDSDGDWFYDETTDKVFTYDTIDGHDDLVYEVVTANFPTHPSTFDLTSNTIPPEDQDGTFTGCKVVPKTGSSGYYYIIFPPRLRLSNRTDVDLYPTDAGNDGTDPVAVTPMYFWDESTDAPGLGTAWDDHYRYHLPSLLDSASWGDRLPDGFLRLEINNEVADGVVFFKPAAVAYQYGYILEIYAPYSITALDAVASAVGTHTTAAYDTGVKVITTGTSTAELLNQIVRMLLNHKHNSTQTGWSSRVDHNDLVGLDPNYDADFDDDGGGYPYWPFGTNDVRLTKSNWENDGHLQYLHRAGSLALGDSDYYRDIYNNAFIGDLLIGSATKGVVVPYFNNVINDSFKVYFGSVDYGPCLYLETAIYDAIVAQGISGEPGLVGISDTDSGLYGIAGAAPGVVGETASVDGVQGGGGDTGIGVHGYGGSTSGVGVKGEAQGGDSSGVEGIGHGDGTGVKGAGGTTGDGVYGLGGASGGYGVVAEQQGNTRAALRTVPQACPPVAGYEGDVLSNSMYNNQLFQCLAAGSPGTWDPVGHTLLAEVTVSPAEVKTLRASPKEIVAAPGAGMAIVFIMATIELDYGGTQYVIPDADDDLRIQYSAIAAVTETYNSAGFIDGANDKIKALSCANPAYEVKENVHLELDNVGSSEYTTGNSSLYVKCWYRLIRTH